MYEAHFGLNRLPFSLTPNTALFYALPPHVEAINTVLAALQMGEGIIKVTGEVGTGKTMLCRLLIQQLPDEVELAYLPTPSDSGETLRQAIAVEFGLDSSLTGANLIDALQRQLVSLRQAGRQAVVVLDESQALSDEALEAIRLLANFETEQEKLIHIVLVGQPELDLRLSSHSLRQLRQRISFSAGLRPLSLAETRAYIEHRLVCSNGSNELISLSGCRLIFKASRGIPRLINVICHKALLHAYGHRQGFVSRAAIVAAIRDTHDAELPMLDSMLSWAWR
uniref:ExeA family protein n=1 Tax=Thaumasiovibrio occultus TaxID=1891184 RepID=UPI000B35F064|nr:AAA family ATPase [Thaumasiovibrio occultus]